MKHELLGSAITIDPDKLAEGLLEMFSEDDLTILRFGMLPAKLMELFEKNLKEKFMSLGYPDEDNPDTHYIHLKRGTIEEYSLKDMVSRAMHLVSVEIYARGNLVV